MSSSTRCPKRRLTSRRCASCALSQEKQQAPSGRHAAAATRQDLRRRYHASQRNDATRTRSRSTCRPSLRSSSSTASACPLSAALQVRIVVMLCTTAQSIAIKCRSTTSQSASWRRFASSRSWSTALDFDERGSAELAKGTNGVVFAGTWRGQPVAVKLLRQGGVLAARSRRPRGGGAPARPAAAQEHHIGFRGISGRADALLPRDRAGAVWLAQIVSGQESVNEKRALPFAYLRRRLCSAHVGDRAPATSSRPTCSSSVSRRAKPSSPS
jgi:hypothetical protein